MTITSSRRTVLLSVVVVLWVGWGLQAGEEEPNEFFPASKIESQEELAPVPADPREADAGSESGAAADDLPPETAVSPAPQCCDQDYRTHREFGIFRWFQRKHDDFFWRYKRIRHYVPPPGTALYSILHKQMENGEAALMVFYRFDFVPADSQLNTGAQLNTGGRRQLGKIARRLRRTQIPIRIEPTPGNRELDEERRRQVIKELEALSLPVSDKWVIIAEPPSRGLDAIDALLIDPSGTRLSRGSATPRASSGGPAEVTEPEEGLKSPAGESMQVYP